MKPGGGTQLDQPGKISLRALIGEIAPFSLNGLFVIAAGATLYFASDLFVPVFVAIFLSIVLRPFVRTMNKVGLPNAIGSLLVVVSLIAVVGIAVLQLAQPVARWVDELPTIVNKLEVELWSLRQSVEEAQQAAKSLKEMAGNADKQASEVVVRGPPLVSQIAGYTWLTVVQIVTGLALLYVLLAQGGTTANAMVRKVTSLRHRSMLQRLLDSVQDKFSAYVRTLTLINLCVGGATAAAMFAIGMPDPLMWGVLATLLNFFPYIGPAVMILVLAIAGFATFDEWYAILAPSAAFIVINAVEAYGITPVVLGRAMTLSPVAVFISMLFWTWAWGVPGGLLSVPILVFINLVCEYAITWEKQRESSEAGKETSAEPT